MTYRGSMFAKNNERRVMVERGLEGVVGLIRWFDRIESVFSRSNCTEDYKMKFAIGTLTEKALSWWNSFAQPIGIEEAYNITWVEFKKLIIKNIEGNVTAFKPQTLEEVINIAQRLMDQVYYPEVVSFHIQSNGKESAENFLDTLLIVNDFHIVPFPGYVSCNFLRYLIDSQGLHIDPAKIEAKNKKYIRGKNQESAFQLLKHKLCEAPILTLPEGNDDFVVYCNTSHQGLRAVLMQREKVITYVSRQIKPNEEAIPLLVSNRSNIILDQKVLNMRQKSLARNCISADYDCEFATILILKRVGPVAYKLELPEELRNVHNTFHVSNLKKYLSDESLVIPMKELLLDDKLNFVEEPVEIMDREVKQLKQSRIPIVKVRWNSKRGPKFTWECEDQIRAKYPHLFSNITPASN
ncbi:putative reverse transcriptase domain-containing protein [Tanacetum coccineum]